MPWIGKHHRQRAEGSKQKAVGSRLEEKRWRQNGGGILICRFHLWGITHNSAVATGQGKVY